MSNSLLLVPLYVNIKSNRPAYTYFEDYIELQHVDLIFICKNNMEVKSHKAVLSTVSEFMKNILLESNQEVVYICLPDVNHRSMKLLLNYLYSGVTKVKELELLELKDILSLLQISLPSASVTQLTARPKPVLDTEQETFENTEENAVSVPGECDIPSGSKKRRHAYIKNDLKIRKLCETENVHSDPITTSNDEILSPSSGDTDMTSSILDTTNDPLHVGGEAVNGGDVFDNDGICVIKLENVQDDEEIEINSLANIKEESEINKLNAEEESILPLLEPMISMIGPEQSDCVVIEERQETSEDSDVMYSDVMLTEDVEKIEEKTLGCVDCIAMSIKVNQEISVRDVSGKYRHIRVHPPDIYGIPQYECVMCSQRFATLRSIRYHIWHSHNIVTDHCKLCHKSFKTKFGFKKHKCNNENTKTQDKKS